MFDKGFCVKGDVKTLLDITDATDDTLITAICERSAAAMEAYIGRRLRRVHYHREVFSGGSEVIRTSVWPIAKIHTLRESHNRDFDDEDNFDELVEGEDYILEASSSGEAPGESGMIRRLGQPFMGSRGAGGMVELYYTGGFKTDDEVALENSSATIGNDAAEDATEIAIKRQLTQAGASADFVTRYTPESQSGGDLLIDGVPLSLIRRHPVFRFATRDVILPCWSIDKITFGYAYKDAAGGTTPMVFFIRLDPRNVTQANLAAMFDLRPDTTEGRMNFGTTTWAIQASYTAVTESTDAVTAGAGANLSYIDEDHLTRMFQLVRETLRKGFLAVKIIADETDAGVPQSQNQDIASHANSTEGDRPFVTIQHSVEFDDDYTVPDDLREANVLQAAHVYQTRKQLGLIQRSGRGVTVASGYGTIKQPITLLPEVKEILAKYATPI